MDKSTLLRHVPLFKDLSSSDLQKVVEIVKVVSFNKGQKVFTEGHTGDSLFIIKSGSVVLKKKYGNEIEQVASLSYGQHFGEEALIDNETRSATVEATEDIDLVEINRGALDNLLTGDMPLALVFYKTLSLYLSRRLRQTTKDLASVKGSIKDISNRLEKLDHFTGHY